MLRRLPLCVVLAACTAFMPWNRAAAERPIRPRAPEFPRNTAWLNSEPFKLKDLRKRRVTLIVFMNPWAANSIRTFRYLNRWWDQYSLKGLMIIGVHDPDFDFDRNPLELRRALKRLGIHFPVLIDSGRRLWKAYQNEGWPAYYLIGPKGRIVYDHLGENGYAQIEREILSALENFNGHRPPASYRIPPDSTRSDCGLATVPIYLGARRGKSVKEPTHHVVDTVLASRDGEITQTGRWQLEPDAARFIGSNSDLLAQTQVIYQGAEALAVIGHGGVKPARLYVKQDNLWLHPGNANTDIQWDKDDRSYALIDAPRLYYLTKNKKEEVHELTMLPAQSDIGIYSLEFSDRCQTDYDHR